MDITNISRSTFLIGTAAMFSASVLDAAAKVGDAIQHSLSPLIGSYGTQTTLATLEHNSPLESIVQQDIGHRKVVASNRWGLPRNRLMQIAGQTSVNNHQRINQFIDHILYGHSQDKWEILHRQIREEIDYESLPTGILLQEVWDLQDLEVIEERLGQYYHVVHTNETIRVNHPDVKIGPIKPGVPINKSGLVTLVRRDKEIEGELFTPFLPDDQAIWYEAGVLKGLHTVIVEGMALTNLHLNARLYEGADDVTRRQFEYIKSAHSQILGKQFPYIDLRRHLYVGDTNIDQLHLHDTYFNYGDGDLTSPTVTDDGPWSRRGVNGSIEKNRERIDFAFAHPLFPDLQYLHSTVRQDNTSDHHMLVVEYKIDPNYASAHQIADGYLPDSSLAISPVAASHHQLSP